MSSDTSTGETVNRKHPLANCEECGLYEGGYAPGWGPEKATYVVIGEAPGAREAKNGKPFVGASGKLLDSVLTHHGIARSDVYVDNVCACRPDDNRTPTTKEMRCCWPRAEAAIQAVDPKVIITVGNTASQTLLRSTQGITQLRVGPPKSHEDWPRVKIIPTFHPAACLRAADSFPHMVADIGKAVSQIEIKWKPPTYKVFDDINEAVQACDELRRLFVQTGEALYVDIECGIDKSIHFGHPEQYKMLCIGISYADDKAVVFSEEVCESSAFKKAFRTLYLDSCWEAHNIKFDAAGLDHYVGDKGKFTFDTMLASYAMDERPGIHSLDYLGVELLGAPDWKNEVKKYVGKDESYAVVPRPILYEYNACDACVGRALSKYFKAELSDKERKLHDFLVEWSPTLMATEMEGMLIDDEYNQQLMDNYLVSLSDLEKELSPWVANPRSPKQVKEALHDMGFLVKSTDEDNLKAVRARVAPDSETNKFINLMLQQRREQKLYGTYVKGIRKRLYNGRIHSSFLLHGTVTGRPASRNPNLFNIPRAHDIRKQFVAGPGNVLIQVDYATGELRVMAVEAKDEFLTGIFAEGRDVHNEFSLGFYGPNFTKDQRVRAKAFVFGVGYGRTAYSVAMEHGISIKQAEEYEATLWAMMPGVKQWQQEKILDVVFKSDGDVETRFGRKRRFWLITDANSKDVKNEALAFVPQSTLSDVCATAFIRLRRDYGMATRVSVYDSILVECRAEDAEETAAIMVRVMEDTATELMGDSVPFPADVKIGTNWGEV